MPVFDETMYVVRITYDNGEVTYKAASGTWATPKLYKRGNAVSAARTVMRPWDKGMKVEIVPVTFSFGEPITVEQQ